MQDTIEEATLTINTTIHSINSSNKVITPKLAQEIIYYRHGHLLTIYGKLPDGVHPNKKVLSSWTQTMKTIINRNTHTKSQNHTPPAPPTQTIIQPVQINPPSSPPLPLPVSDSDSEQGSPKRSWWNYSTSIQGEGECECCMSVVLHAGRTLTQLCSPPLAWLVLAWVVDTAWKDECMW